MLSRLNILWVLIPLAVSPGCVELGLVPPPSDGGGIDNGDGDGNGDEPDVAPIVRITASNTTPQPNEELILRCEVINQAGPGVTFEFRANGLASTRLQTSTATARVVVQESDAGTAFSFICTGTNAVGTGPASRPVLIIVTAPPEPPP